MARSSSLNCLSCRNPYQTPHSLNCLPPFHRKPLFFTEKCFVASPSPKSAPNFRGSAEFLRGSPRCVPISPFSSDLFRFALLVFGNAPIYSDLFRFARISSDLFSERFQNKSGKPLLPTPFASSRITDPVLKPLLPWSRSIFQLLMLEAL